MRHCLALILLLSLPLHAAQLTLNLGGAERQWSTAQLLAHPQARDIRIDGDVSYKKTMHYRAVPMVALLEGVAPAIICRPWRWMALPPNCPLPRCSATARHAPGWPSRTPPTHGQL